MEKTPAHPVSLGRVELDPGAFEIAVEGVELKGKELMRLRGITLTPVVREGAPAS